MDRIAGCVTVFVLAAGLACAQIRDVRYQGDLMPMNVPPNFDHGYLAAYAGKRVDLFSADGTLLYGVQAVAPGADWVSIDNAAVNSDGTIALALRTYINPGRARGGGIAVFDSTGRQIRYFETGEYLPAHVTFGPDGSIWAVGWLGENAGANTRDYLILRNYAPDGRELGAFLPRSTFATHEHAGFPQPAVMPNLGAWEIRVVNDSVEAILWREKIWVQTDLTGHQERRWQIGPTNDQPGQSYLDGPTYRPSAITNDGRAWRKEGNQLKLFDRSAGIWNTISSDAPEGILLGAEGDKLVFLLRDNHTLRWVPAPGTPGGSPAAGPQP